MGNTQPYKAIVAFILTFAATLLASIEGEGNIADLTWPEWLTIILSALVTAGAVFQVSNPPREPEPPAVAPHSSLGGNGTPT